MNEMHFDAGAQNFGNAGLAMEKIKTTS